MMNRHWSRKRNQPQAERLEDRRLMTFAGGTGPIVTNLIAQTGRSGRAIVINFDGPLDVATAQNTANYQVDQVTATNPEIITKSGPRDPVVSAVYDVASRQVTLNLAKPLRAGVFYRVAINGTPGTDALTTTYPPQSGLGVVLFDGDNDSTAGGDFYGLVAAGTSLRFTDSTGNRGTVKLSGGGRIDLWRELNGDVDQLSVIGAIAGQSTLTGSVLSTKGSTGEIVIPSYQGLTGVNNLLPSTFVSTPTTINSPLPVVATSQNLSYSLQITPATMPGLPSLQATVYAQENGLWLLFGGRTNGLHGFNPTGLENFPPAYQNNDIFVINPSTGQSWSEPWSATGLPSSMTASLSSSNQEFFQQGDRLYAVGGYSFDHQSQQFTTYDTLSAMSVSGMINMVIASGTANGMVKQIADPRFSLTGGDMGMINGRMYLDFGQDFQGGYGGANFGASLSQVYSDEVRSFKLIDRGRALGITGYQAQRDPVNFRRRDGNLALPSILPNGKAGINVFGGVFTAAGNAYQEPILIGSNGIAQTNQHYQQYFSQYDSAKVPLYDAKNHQMHTVLFGGISLYDYNGTLSAPQTGLPFENDVTSLVQSRDGSIQEYIMPSQLPGGHSTPQTLYGAEAAFFTSPGVPTYSNGVIKLNKLRVPTTIGYIYGGINAEANETNPTPTNPGSYASSQVFIVTLVPNVE